MNNSNYSATIVRLGKLTMHPNADKLQLANIYGNTVIVGLDNKEGELGIFFNAETQLSEEFCTVNDLIRRKDESGKVVGGLLESNRRIRAIKLRGTPSMGLWLPIASIDYVGSKDVKPHLEEGYEFTSLGGHEICKKYIPSTRGDVGRENRTKNGKQPRKSRIIPDQFRFHFDTAQLGKNIHRIKPGDLISITWKLHGTSAICGNVLTKKKLNVLQKLGVHIGHFLGLPTVNAYYDYIYASRRVVKNEFEEAKVHYYKEDLWTKVGKEQFEGKLHHGETVYYEIVGYTSDGAFIQKPFDYRCEKGTYKVYVYRITYTTPNGTVVELSWHQVKDRCAELGVSNVPEVFYGEADITFTPSLETLEQWQEQYLGYLKARFVHDQDCQFCENKVPSEGICVRKEGLNIEVFKLKNFRFLEHETKALDNNEVDLESTQSE